MSETKPTRHWVAPALQYLFYGLVSVCIFDRALASQRETLRLKREHRRIRAQIVSIKKANLRRERIRAALTSDRFYVERILRERWGFRRPGEEAPRDREARAEAPDPRRRLARH
jgi:hypothetical protein